MSNSNRAAKIAKAYKVLKKHYKPVEPSSDRSLLEHMLYACCLENARYETADEAFAKLQESYFDWNEIRVTTISELSEVMSDLPDPAAAAMRLKRTLQAIFETHYAFDIEFLRKQNLGKAIQELEKLDKDNLFCVAYVTQAGLGGHSIPLSRSALSALQEVGVITEAEAQSGRVPGLERAISKSKGIEFASLLQQMAADYHAGPNTADVRTILQEIDPSSKERHARSSSRKEAAASGPDSETKAKKRRDANSAPKTDSKAGKTEEDAAKKSPGVARKSSEDAAKIPSAAKKSSEEAARKPPTVAKKATEDAAKKPPTVAKKAIEDTAKKDTEDTAKKAAEDSAKKATEEAAKKPPTVAKKVGEEAAKKATEEAAKKPPTVAKKTTEDEAKKPPAAGKKTTEDAAKKPPTAEKKSSPTKRPITKSLTKKKPR